MLHDSDRDMEQPQQSRRCGEDIRTGNRADVSATRIRDNHRFTKSIDHLHLDARLRLSKQRPDV